MDIQADRSAVVDNENLALLNTDNEPQVSFVGKCMYSILVDSLLLI